MKLSIITINFNKHEGLDKTLESVRAQTFKDFEQIVVDGGSTDVSLDVIRAHEPSIARWVSEPDSGVYNAMNKGISMASGEFVLFLNSGDCLASADVLEKVFEEDSADIGMLFGDTVRKTIYGSGEACPAPEQMTVFAFYKFRICHQSIFYRRELFETFGLYDETYQISGDAEFTLRCIRAGVKARRIKIPISIYEGGGMSATPSEASTAEKKRVWSRHLGPGIWEDYARFALLEAECRRLQKAEDWIEDAKRKPLWFNIALVCKWRWDRLVGKRR